MDTTKAAQCIQRVWRQSLSLQTSKEIVDRYLTTGPTSSIVETTSFNSLLETINDQNVIQTCKDTLQRIHHIVIHRHGQLHHDGKPVTVNERVFLAGYLIAFYESQAFNTMGDIQRSVRDNARTFISIVELIMQQSTRLQRISKELTEQYQPALLCFVRAYLQWKHTDQLKIISSLKAAFFSAHRALAYMKGDDSEQEVLVISLNANITKIRKQLEELAGPNVLEELDVQLTEMIVSDTMPTNQQIAHEILLDPFFKMEDDCTFSSSSLSVKIAKEISDRACWASIMENICSTTPVYDNVLDVLTNIKESIECEIEDKEIIEQIERGELNTDHMTNLISRLLNTIKSKQLPERIAGTNALWENLQHERKSQSTLIWIVKALRFLLNRATTIRIDAFNKRVSSIAGIIRTHGLDYEREKFKNKLDTGVFTLERTKAWVGHFVFKHITTLRAGGSTAFVDAHMDGIHNFVLDIPVEAITKFTVPETLSLDANHLAMLREEFLSITIGSVVYLRLSVLIPNGPLITCMGQWLTTIQHNTNAKDITSELNAIAYQHPFPNPDMKTQADLAIAQVYNPDDAVHRVVKEKLAVLWKKLARGGTLDLNDTLFTNVFVRRIEKAVAKFLKICALNRAVHLDTYNTLIHEAMMAC